MRRKQTNFSQSGFTLVELLIVIVIIGILAGVVIGVLNPIQQQARARDGSTRAQLDKMALSAKSLYVSSPRSTGRSPSVQEFTAGIGSITNLDAATCNVVAGNLATDTGSCLFEIAGSPLPADCDAGSYRGEGAGTQCRFAYFRGPNTFRIGARGAAQPRVIFVYEYIENVTGPTAGTTSEGFYTCPTAFDVRTASPSAGGSGCTLVS